MFCSWTWKFTLGELPAAVLPAALCHLLQLMELSHSSEHPLLGDGLNQQRENTGPQLKQRRVFAQAD